MSEEKNADFKTEPVSATSKRITSIGHDPWMAKAIRGTVKFSRADAGQLKVTALDHGGYPAQQLGSASEIKLIPTTLYYLIQR
jgi:hypothetical protein